MGLSVMARPLVPVHEVHCEDQISLPDQKSGEKNNWTSNKIKTLVHSVYPQKLNQTHGHRYAYISEWLSKNFSNKIKYILENLVVVIYSYYLLFRKFFGDLIKEDKNFICDEHGHLFLMKLPLHLLQQKYLHLHDLI